jgi:hypothetical protein
MQIQQRGVPEKNAVQLRVQRAAFAHVHLVRPKVLADGVLDIAKAGGVNQAVSMQSSYVREHGQSHLSQENYWKSEAIFTPPRCFLQTWNIACVQRMEAGHTSFYKGQGHSPGNLNPRSEHRNDSSARTWNIAKKLRV